MSDIDPAANPSAAPPETPTPVTLPDTGANRDAVIQQLLAQQHEMRQTIDQLTEKVTAPIAPPATTAAAQADEFSDPLAQQVSALTKKIDEMRQRQDLERDAFINQQIARSAVSEAEANVDQFAAANPLTASNPEAARFAKQHVLSRVESVFKANPKAYVTPYHIQQEFNAKAAEYDAVIKAHEAQKTQTQNKVEQATVNKAAGPPVTGGVVTPTGAPRPAAGTDDDFELRRQKTREVFSRSRQ